MTKRDALFLTLLFSFLTGLLGPFLFSAHLTAFNFGDIYAYHMPLRHLLAERLQAGELPLWNPYWFAGMPLWANPQTAALYPPSVLFHFFPFLPALNADLLAHLLLAASGGYLLLRRMRLSCAGAFMLAAAYTLSPFVLGRLPQGVPTLLASLAWIPWTWLAFLSGIRGFFAVVLALQGLSGHPQFAAANLLGLFAVAALRPRPIPKFLHLLRETALAGLLTAVQAFPTLEFLARSVRSHWDAAFAAGYALPARAWLSLLSPAAWGTPWSSFGRYPSVWFETSTLYLGLVPLAFAVWGLFRAGRRGKPAFFALIALGIFLAMGGADPRFLRAPARFAVLSLWGLFLAAAAGWKSLSPRLKVRTKLLAAALTLLDLACYAGRFIGAQDSRPFLSPALQVAGRLDSAWRLATDPELANPNKLSLYHLSNATGYEAFYLETAAAYASRSEGRAAADGSRTYLTRIQTPEMESLAVRYYLTPRDLGPKGLMATDGPLRLYENPAARPLAFLDPPAAPVSLDRPRPEWWRARVLKAGAGRLVFSLPRYPGWSAWMGGQPVPLDAWRGFLTSLDLGVGGAQGRPGEPVDVALRFTPTGWAYLVLLTSAAWLVLSAGFARGLANRRISA